MKFHRPVIAITHSLRQSKSVVWALKLSVWLAGGKPISITSKKRANFFDYDGLILSGGVDLNPELYGSIKKAGYKYEQSRDELEMKHLTISQDNKIPVLGICRGCQLMNVFRGGTLHMDITKVYEKAQYPSHLLGYLFFRKKIIIVKPSKLFNIIKKNCLDVNSIHKQSIDKLGRGLEVTASEVNQITQCIEDPASCFFMGVQFHPEFLIYKKRFRALFVAFIQSVYNRRK